MKNFYIFICLLLLPIISQSQNEITGTVEYNLKSNTIYADLDLSLNPEILSHDTLLYWLHANADIESLTSDNVKSYEFSELASIGNMRSHKLIIIVDTLNLGSKINISLKYTIPDYTWYMHKEHWLEIHSENTTLPIQYNANHNWDLKIVMPKEFTIVTDATLEKVNETTYKYSLRDSDKGLTMFGGDRIIKKQYPQSKYPNLKLYSYFDEYGMMDSLNTYMNRVLDFYHSTFAQNSNQSDFTMMIIPYIHNFSFKRENFVTNRFPMQGDRFIDEIEYSLKTPFHEIAHLWWINAPSNTYDNWLNESFAEYWSILALGEILGEDNYERNIDNIKYKINKYKYGPVIEFKSPYTSILYTEGALVLHELNEKLGYENFIEFSRILVDQKVDSVDKCISILRKDYGNEVADWLFKRLRE